MSNAPIRPERPPRPDEKSKPRGGNLVTIGLALTMAVGGVVSLMVMPLVGYAPVIVLAVFCFIALHYFTWGWWLSKRLMLNANDADDQAESGPPTGQRVPHSD